MPHHMRLTLLLIITSLLASAFDTIALTSDDIPPAPEDAVPPADDETDTPSTDLLRNSLFETYEEADLDLVGVDQYHVTWTVRNPDEAGICFIKGYYDDTVLKTSSSIKSCFDRVRNGLNEIYAGGGSIFTRNYYYPSESYPYCAVDCSPKSSASVVSSMRMSLVSLAFALLAFIALNCF